MEYGKELKTVSEHTINVDYYIVCILGSLYIQIQETFPIRHLERKRKYYYFEMEAADFHVTRKWVITYTEPEL